MTKKTLFIFAIATIVIVSIITFIAFRTNPEGELDPIKTAMISRFIDPKYAITAEKYHENPANTFKTELKEQLYEVVDFGIALLSLYLLDNTKTQYLKDVEDLIKRIHDKIEGPVSEDKKKRWDENWYYYSVLLNRLFAMYEYIGNNKDIITICHERIIQITPKLDTSLGSEFKGKSDILLVAIPRLLTLRKNEPEKYDIETKSESFDNLREQMNLKLRTDNDIHNGIYQDYSCIRGNAVATFSGINILGGFHLNVYRALKFEENISTIVAEIFNRILHPKLYFIPYGLFGRDSRISREISLKTQWPNYERNQNLDVNIFPFIGLGVFKSEKFVFSVRVQRQGIAAYEFDKWNQKLALGWIQMRKLYHTEVDYKSYDNKMEWEQLKVQPGVILFATDSDNNFTAFTSDQEYYTIAKECGEIKSFIGHLKTRSDKKILYWFNKYKFESFYGKNVVISEIGVCTDNGLVMRHEINNNSGKKLKLISKDKDINDKTERMHFKASSNKPGSETFIPSGEGPVTVNWYQLVDETIEPKIVNWNDANNSMSFNFDGDKYIIEHHGTQRGQYHIVRCNDTIILAGNSSSLRKDSITHRDTKSSKDILFERNSDTLMYKPEQS
ncbi:uncharacterized protein LOC130678430 [Microplitis mediator]|uniref:uncharacterized protein LOC130678430 n=1 Tax=Microplitis mediator TaxID=375433 RepID=UPI0025574A46|nr:uncharacterized protein LOC130678430 [Microplitis mediator]